MVPRVRTVPFFTPGRATSDGLRRPPQRIPGLCLATLDAYIHVNLLCQVVSSKETFPLSDRIHF